MYLISEEPRSEVGYLSLLTPDVRYWPPAEPFSGVAHSNKSSKSVQSHFRMESTALHFSYTESRLIHMSTMPAGEFTRTRGTATMSSISETPTNEDCGSTFADHLRRMGKSEQEVKRLCAELDKLDATWKWKAAGTNSSEVQTVQTSHKSSVNKTATSSNRKSCCAVVAEKRNRRNPLSGTQRRRPPT
jgi:hypothetical protein